MHQNVSSSFLQLRSAVSKEKISGVADLIEEQGKVVKVRKKPDMIQGKILRIMDKKLQIENYGFVSLDAEFCVYHLKSDGTDFPGCRNIFCSRLTYR